MEGVGKSMKLPFFNYYAGDFELDTAALTLEEVGAYQRILNQLWVKGTEARLPNDDGLIARLLRVSIPEWQRLKAVLLEGEFAVLKVDDDNRIYNNRLCEEYGKAVKRFEKAKAAIDSRWHAEDEVEDTPSITPSITQGHTQSDTPAILTQNSELKNPKVKTLEPQNTSPAQAPVASVSNFDLFYEEFKKVYPARGGQRVGIDSVAKTEARKIAARDWDAVIQATKNYALIVKLPVDPVRFFKSREYPAGLWREYVNAKPGESNAANKTNGFGQAKPEGAARAGVIPDHDTVREEQRRREEARKHGVARSGRGAPS